MADKPLIKPFAVVPNENTQLTQKRMQEFGSQIGDIASGRRVGPVALGAAESRILHGLNHVPTAWVITSKDAFVDIIESSAFDNKALYLTAGSSVNITLWVW